MSLLLIHFFASSCFLFYKAFSLYTLQFFEVVFTVRYRSVQAEVGDRLSLAPQLSCAYAAVEVDV